MADLRIQRTNTILYCRNWRETVAFYRDRLELPMHCISDWFVEFQLGDQQFISIADAAKATIAPADGRGITLSWQVADLQAAHKLLISRDIEVGSLQIKWGAHVFYFHDPEGHRIELWSP